MQEINLIFAFYANTEKDEKEALLLASSIRSFAGCYNKNPIWAMVPSGAKLSVFFIKKAIELNLTIVRFSLSENALSFPFAAKVFAASTAENKAVDSEILVWLDKDSLVFNTPTEFDLATTYFIGVTPVDHTLIGSYYNQPPDDFWTKIYNDCRTTAHNIFPLTTTVDQRELRAYFNAGMIVVRPKQGFLQEWQRVFESLYLADKYHQHYQANRLYAIFMHQAVLAGLILHTYAQDEIKILSRKINYPIHMHKSYPLSIKPRVIDKEMQTARYDMYFDEPQADLKSIFSAEFIAWFRTKQNLYNEGRVL